MFKSWSLLLIVLSLASLTTTAVANTYYGQVTSMNLGTGNGDVFIAGNADIVSFIGVTSNGRFIYPCPPNCMFEWAADITSGAVTISATNQFTGVITSGYLYQYFESDGTYLFEGDWFNFEGKWNDSATTFQGTFQGEYGPFVSNNPILILSLSPIATPEPSSLILLGTGCFVGMRVVRQKLSVRG